MASSTSSYWWQNTLNLLITVKVESLLTFVALLNNVLFELPLFNFLSYCRLGSQLPRHMIDLLSYSMIVHRINYIVCDSTSSFVNNVVIFD